MYFSIIIHASATPEQINLRKLDDNPGIIPVKIGTAKIKDYSYTLIHYYDLNPILLELNKLNLKSQKISETIGTHKYSNDTNSYEQLLKLTQDRVENKIKEIIPHPKRFKRGLINGLGSVFKAVTGNLDASDGDRYEKLIYELKENQKNLQANILKQNSLSLTVIEKFNSTIQQINYNEKLLESKINQISLIVQKTIYREDAVYHIKDIINQILDVYEIINSILQDVENSLTFSKLKIMHPSIIRTEDLFIELTNLQKLLGYKQMPVPITLENTLLYEKIINLESFVLNNKITYLLHIPIMHPQTFNYFHIYSVPIYSQSLFKVVLPRNKFLLKNQLHYAYYNQECQEIIPESYICEKETLNEIQEDSPCEVKLIHSDKDTSSCKQTEVKMTQSIIDRLDKTDQWILILPVKEAVKLKCFGQSEARNIIGTYLCQIPIGCQITTNLKTIINDQKPINTHNEPILFPDLATTDPVLPVLNLSQHIHDLKLDSLHRLRNEVIQNQPQLVFSQIRKMPSLFTILLYILITICCLFVAYKKMKSRNQRKCPKEEKIEIQLPRQA